MSSQTYQKLYRCIEQMKVIDAHEHVLPEAERVAQPVDVFTLFSHYCICDLGSAGMPPEQRDRLFDASLPLQRRWELFEHFWPEIRQTSYSRAVLITLRDIFGVKELNRDNCVAVSQKIQAMNRPGLYEKILR